MIEAGESYRDAWVHAAAFDAYEKNRVVVGPAFSKLISDELNSVFEVSDRLLEVGAGGGAMKHYAGEFAADFDWIVTEQNQAFLDLPRHNGQTKLAASSAGLPVSDQSLNGVIGLGVLDTLSTNDLQLTSKETMRTLKNGGYILHILDMMPDLVVEVTNSLREGKLVLPYIDDEHNTGLHLIMASTLEQKLQSMDVDQHLANCYLQLLNDPERTILTMHQTGKNVLPFLGEMAEKLGLVIESKPGWWQHFGERLAMVSEAAGLSVVKNEVVTATVIANLRDIPGGSSVQGATDVVRKQGTPRAMQDPRALILPGKVKLHADSHVFIAQKQ